ncbi:MAG: AsmA-like C-terminal region-containing protein, partial [Planktotalea sp.]|uniref:AsmA-like C-terminal region-containing protein n=1 Tax=Planktotalea sp. TaxID=2029877 RepID=UPI003C77F132
NIIGGDVSKARLAFRAEAGQTPQLDLDLSYSNASLRFMKQMPPVQGGRGYLRIEGNRFLATTEAGYVNAAKGGRINVAGTSFEIPDMRVRGARAIVRLATKSTITGALSMLDQKPFEFLSKAGQSVTLADGQAEVTGRIDLPLKQKIPAPEIKYNIAGKITGVRSTSLVEGRVLVADQLDLRANTSGIDLQGSGRIDAVPFKGAWSMPLGKAGAGSQLTGQIELSERFVDTFNIGLPPGSVSGKGQGDITLDLKPDAAPSFALTSNLTGVALRIDPLGWSKGANTRGALSVRGSLGGKTSGPPKVERLSLDAPGLKASGSVTINANGTLERASFDRVQAGDWLDAPITLSGRGANATPGVNIAGGVLDMRRIPAQNSTGSGAAVPLSVKLNRLQVTKDIALRDFTGTFVSDRGLNGSFNGQLNGDMRITGQTIPKGGRTAVQIKSTNAGATISAAGLLENANEGAMTLTLSPRASAGHYDGTLEIANLRLRDAPPALAVLSAASGIGLLEQMDGRGLMFTEVSSTFRITPKTVTVTKASAVGPSLGLSVDGYYDVASKTMDMQGVVSPFFAINGIGSILTRKGEGLIGFSYTLDGAAASPRVQVNPLSLFTPGMFREIFRRPPPQLSQ